MAASKHRAACPRVASLAALSCILLVIITPGATIRGAAAARHPAPPAAAAATAAVAGGGGQLVPVELIASAFAASQVASEALKEGDTEALLPLAQMAAMTAASTLAASSQPAEVPLVAPPAVGSQRAQPAAVSAQPQGTAGSDGAMQDVAVRRSMLAARAAAPLPRRSPAPDGGAPSPVAGMNTPFDA